MIHIIFIQKVKKCTLILLACLYVASSYADSDFNPHSTNLTHNGEGTECLSCHKKLPSASMKFSGMHIMPDMSHFVKNETEMCSNCHGDENSSHIVGVTPDYSVPADLPLDKNNQVSCLTCHYIHGSLKSDKPMASTSIMDHILNRSRLSKSYILRRNNAEGDLCLACHSK